VRKLHGWKKAPTDRARSPSKGKASLAVDEASRFQQRLPPSLKEAGVALAEVVPVGPETLNTLHGRVVLSGPDLTSIRPDPEGDASLRGLRTILLLDGREQRSTAELEGVRQEFLEYFHKSYTLSEKLHEMFTTASAFYEKHERLRHPPIFYLGHTASFYVNKLHLGKYISSRIDPVLEMQMAVGVDEMSWDDWDSNSYVWQSGAEARADEARAAEFLQTVLDFRRDVRLLVDRMIRTQPMEWPIKKDSFWWVIMMGIEHDHIHLETSSVIHRQADISVVQPVGAFPICDRGRFHKSPDSSAARSLPPNRLIPIEHGTTRLGRSWEGTKTYGWDNEFGKESHVDVAAFAASEFLVSNKEFMDFLQADGYKTQRFWSEEGWSWVSDMRPTAPGFWRVGASGEYHLRTLCEEVPMPWDWPVECSHHEAAAFCKYLSEQTGKSLRLPMEDEYLRLRDSVPTDLQDSAHGPSWGKNTPGNVNLAYWASPCPVDTFRSPSGVHDVLGNAWQHCATHIDTLEGFETHPLYDDFTTPTVGEHHSRIMGGSWMSCGAHGATRDGRYGFRRHFYQHAGFRYIESHRQIVNSALPYERDRALCDAFRFHFDDDASPSSSFHRRLAARCAEVLAAAGRPINESRVMELGCGPGRTVLELARLGASAAHGAERSSKAFQCTAQRLLVPGGRLRWMNHLEGEFVEARELFAAEVGVEDEASARTQFFQMPDFAAVDTNKFHDYDLVVFAEPGALGSSSDPLRALGNVQGLLKPGGVLALGTQYEWSALGSPLAEGAGSGEEVVARALSKWFEPIAEPTDLEYVRPETERKSQCGTQHLTFWKRRAEPLEGIEADGSSGEAPRASLSEVEQQGQAMYDEELTVGQYLDFHFGPSSSYPSACAARCIAAARDLGVPLGRALEVGGGPGRAAIELSRAFDHVDSGDYSSRFVELGQSLINDGELRWQSLVDRTAGTTEERCVRAEDLKVGGSVTFSKVDAQAMPEELTGYDLVCGFNLIDEVARPKDFLSGVKSRLNPDGLLVLSSPYSWAEEFTSKENWLGGFKYGDNDGPSTYEGIKALLTEHGFVEALPAEEIQFRIDELGNGRKSQQTRAQMTFWRLTGR